MIRIPAATALAALLVVSACSSSGGGSTKNSTAVSAPAGSSAVASSSSSSSSGGDTITIQNFAYSGSLTVAPGAKITVIDKDSAAHTLTDKDGKFDSGNVAGSGGTASFTAPTAPGSYQLVCKYHPQMSGTLTVK